jgi:hypothetical protein
MWKQGARRLALGDAEWPCCREAASKFWLGILFAHVVSEFFYKIASAARSVLGEHPEEPRYAQRAVNELVVFHF